MRDAANIAPASRPEIVPNWALALGFAALAIPAAIKLGAQTWSSEEGAHGPLVICTGAWLLWRQYPSLRQEGMPGKAWVIFAGFCLALPMYIFGEAFDFITVEVFSLYAIAVLLFYSAFGARQIAVNWFIFLYLAFAIPPPRSWLDL